MTILLMKRYLDSQTYLKIEEDHDVDNIDQRIQQEVGPLCDMVLSIPDTVLYAVLGISMQGWVLTTISMPLFYGVLVYATFSSAITWLIYRPYIRLNFDSTVSEADLRYGILHIRMHAETVALYRGERAEAASVANRLHRAIRIAISMAKFQIAMNISQSLLETIWMILPVVWLVPMYFAGKIEFGAIAQGTAAASLLLSGIRGATNFIPLFAQSAPHVVRLAQIIEKSASVAAKVGSAQEIQFMEACALSVRNLTLQTPDRQRVLVRNLSLRIAAGQSLMIIGKTGVGKSSLLKAMASIWTNGSGSVAVPSREKTLFLPQRPYMLLGSLRDQILYPAIGSDCSDKDLQLLMEVVALPCLAARHGGFDTTIDWARVLSLGEQQRIGFARALVAKPEFVFLDEATSAVDLPTEDRLYSTLKAAGATLISIGHRDSLLRYHDVVLEILDDASWRISRVTDFES